MKKPLHKKLIFENGTAAVRPARRRAKRRIERTIDLGEVGPQLMEIMLNSYIFQADHKALDLAGSMMDEHGNRAPVKEMVTAFLIESGRLLPAEGETARAA